MGIYSFIKKDFSFWEADHDKSQLFGISQKP